MWPFPEEVHSARIITHGGKSREHTARTCSYLCTIFLCPVLSLLRTWDERGHGCRLAVQHRVVWELVIRNIVSSLKVRHTHVELAEQMWSRRDRGRGLNTADRRPRASSIPQRSYHSWPARIVAQRLHIEFWAEGRESRTRRGAVEES